MGGLQSRLLVHNAGRISGIGGDASVYSRDFNSLSYAQSAHHDFDRIGRRYDCGSGHMRPGGCPASVFAG